MDELIALTQRAGELAQTFLGNLHVTRKQDHSLLTQADTAVSDFIIKELTKLYPEDDIFSEEQFADVDWNGRVWVIDPIDGTSAFARGDNDWAVCIGLLEQGVPVLGVVCASAQGWVSHATKGQGAYFNDKRIHVSDVKQSQDATGYVTKSRGKGRSEVRVSLGTPRTHPYSAAAKIVRIATGDADAYLHLQCVLSKWDTAAAQIILEEAGGCITTLDGTPLDYTQKSTRWEGGVLATNTVLHERFTTLF